MFSSLALACLILLGCGACALEDGSGIAGEPFAPGFHASPVNPACNRFVDSGNYRMLNPAVIQETRTAGEVPSLINRAGILSFPVPSDPPGQYESLPAAFDLRTYGRVSPVKDQGIFGTGSAFATYASLESTLMPRSPAPDFSEKNLANKYGFSFVQPDGGGNIRMSTAVLTGWGGPVNETADPYPRGGQWQASPSFTPAWHVQDVQYFPARINRTDTAAIKGAIVAYGAVYSSYYWNSSFYSSKAASYYQPPAAPDKVPGWHHAVAIIGWNDSYPATNFRVRPAGNGAWLVKNSWGTAWGNNGYFYLSYYDKYFGSALVSEPSGNTTYRETALFRAEPGTNYQGIYSYDSLGEVRDYWYGLRGAGSYATIYTATAASRIAAVGLYTTDQNVPVTIWIYRNPQVEPVSGTLAYRCTTMIAAMGYHTVRFPVANQVPVSKGTRFSLVVSVTNPKNEFYIPVEENYPGYSSGIVAYPGQGFVSHGGWTDLTTLVANSHICLKAYTVAP